MIYPTFLRRFARLALPVFACAFLSVSAQAQAPAAASAFTPAQQAEMKTLVHDYLVNNPEVVVDALKAYQSKREMNAQNEFATKLTQYKGFMTNADTPFLGSPQGKKVIVEFFDYNCPFCKRTVEDVTQLIKDDKDVKVFLKDFPILSSTSNDAARWALAAQKQGKYAEFHIAMMRMPTPGERSTEDMYVKISKDLNLNVDKMRADANSQEIKDKIAKNLDVARALHFNGTPTFIINDKLYPGYLGLDGLKQALAGKFAPMPE